jgi:outer membrane receptor for Fe3+-dicitrate
MTPAMPENKSPWREQPARHNARRRAAFIEDVLENWKYHVLPWLRD